MAKHDHDSDQATSTEYGAADGLEELSAAQVAAFPLPTDSSPPTPAELGTAGSAEALGLDAEQERALETDTLGAE